MITRLKHYNPGASDMVNDWQVLDASGQVLGRLATRVAMFLMGKHKPNYVPHMLSGDFVVVINARDVKITGLKAKQKIYKRYSQYPGTLKEIPYERMQEKFPERIIEMAVKGMLPKNKLGRKMLGRLKVYAGPEHPHSAQVIGSERRETRDAEAHAKAEKAAAAAAIRKATAAKQAAEKPAATKEDAPETDVETGAVVAAGVTAADAVATGAAKKKTPAKKAGATKKPAAKKPATAKTSTAKKPAAKKAPAAKTSAATKPAAKKPAVKKKPAAKKPASPKATPKKTTTSKSGDSGEK